MSPSDVAYQSKAIKLSQELVRDFFVGQHAPGTRLPTQADLAKRYGASRPTIRRALNLLAEKHHLVKEPQKGAVVPSRPGEAAGINQIAFVAPGLNETTHAYVRGVNESLDHERFSLATYCAHSNLDQYRRIVQNVAAMRPAGILLTTMPEEHCRIHAEIFTQAEIPVVTIGHPQITGLTCDRVDESGVDNARKVARLILQLGVTDIAYLGTMPRQASEETIVTLRSELGERGVKLPEDRVFIVDARHGYMIPPDPFIDARQYMAKLLAGGFRCQLLVAGHDFCGCGALQAMLNAGIKVPREMKLVSVMKAPIESYTPMKLTTVDFNQAEEGRIALKLLLRRIEGYQGPVEVHHVAVELVEGETT
jgi:GntR family transcriptional regulator of arabinose operon